MKLMPPFWEVNGLIQDVTAKLNELISALRW
jgi:hypothetical protein